MKSKLNKKVGDQYREGYDETIKYGERHPRGQRHVEVHENPSHMRNYIGSPQMKHVRLEK